MNPEMMSVFAMWVRGCVDLLASRASREQPSRLKIEMKPMRCDLVKGEYYLNVCSKLSSKAHTSTDYERLVVVYYIGQCASKATCREH